MSEPKPAAVPSRKGYLLAAAILVGSLVAMGIFLGVRLAALGQGLIQVVVPGEVTLALAEPGSYTIFHERNSVVDGRLYASESISGLAVSLRAPAGAPVALEPVTTSSSYTFGGRTGVAAFSFEVATPGSYRLAVRYADGRREPRAVLAIGRNFMGGLLTTIFGALALAFGGGALAVWIAVRTYRRNKALLSTSP